jgi:hypothetical protein
MLHTATNYLLKWVRTCLRVGDTQFEQ